MHVEVFSDSAVHKSQITGAMQVLRIARDVAGALHCIHSKGYAHNDLKVLYCFHADLALFHVSAACDFKLVATGRKHRDVPRWDTKNH